MSDNHNRPFAVITGISNKLGMEMARQFASHGYDMLLTSSSDGIANAEDELRAFGVDVTGIEVKLFSFTGVEKLRRAIESFNRPVDVLVMTFMNGVSGEFAETDLKREIRLINHNNVAAIHLTKIILKEMINRGQGKILYATSMPMNTPSALEAVFKASMSFLMSFTESLQFNVRDKGVNITTMFPMYKEETQDLAHMAQEGFEALMNGRTKVYEASLKSKLQNWAGHIIPDRIKTEIQRRVNEVQTGHH